MTCLTPAASAGLAALTASRGRESGYSGNNDQIEVVVTRQKEWTFGRVFGLGPLSVTARAVVEKREVSAGSGYGFLVLNPTECDAFDKSGSGDLWRMRS